MQQLTIQPANAHLLLFTHHSPPYSSIHTLSGEYFAEYGHERGDVRESLMKLRYGFSLVSGLLAGTKMANTTDTHHYASKAWILFFFFAILW